MTRTRVAILGGGLSGLVTAFNLSAPEQNQQYDITIYQLGWRLGGKCATGRNPDHHQRIQEHGLHVFMGQYDNAFAMVQRLYSQAAKPPFPDWRAGYTQVPAMSLMEASGRPVDPLGDPSAGLPRHPRDRPAAQPVYPRVPVPRMDPGPTQGTARSAFPARRGGGQAVVAAPDRLAAWPAGQRCGTRRAAFAARGDGADQCARSRSDHPQRG
ncbi:MAG: hypothetical protein C0515_11915 [Novosphingobium sp.]|nr:hypothetical protein [Novosphingobium sp.]